MADNVTLNAGSGGAVLATDDITAVHYQIIKTAFGALDTAVLAIAGAGAVTTGTQRVTLASDDPAVALLGTIDTDTGAIAASLAILDRSADLDSGVGSDIVPLVGLAVAASGGAVIITGDATNGLDVDVTRVTGTVTVDGSGVTQPVSLASVPSHAVTNAGTFAVQVDGAALTALQLIDNLVLAEDAAHVTADPGVQLLAVQTATPVNRAGLDGDYEPLQLSAGRLWTSAVIDTALPAGTNNIGDVDILSIAAGDNNIGNVDVVTLPALPAGTNNIGDVDVLSIIPGTGATNLGKAEDVAHASGDTGVMALAIRDDTLAAVSGTELDYEPLHTTGLGGLWVTQAPNTAGGLSFYKTIDLDESEEEIKATAGQLYSILAFNRTAAPLYLKLYNATAANVVVGTTVPDITLVVPANADSDGAGFVWSNDLGIAFSTAMTAAVTTLVADNDATAPGANDCVACFLYK